jgi:hypothetical protein
MQYIEIRTNPEYKFDEVLTKINYNFSLLSGGSSYFSGGTVSGNTNFLGQILSGGTNLYDIFLTNDYSISSTYIQPGSNITTGGTMSSPIVSVVESPSFNNINLSGNIIGANSSLITLSAGTIYSGSTNLYDIFLTTSDGNDITRVQPGSNITTGGTDNFPIINLTASPNLNGLYFSGTAEGYKLISTYITGTSIYSGSTELSDLFASLLQINELENKLQTKANLSGASFTGNVLAPSFSSLTLSSNTIYSGSTNLYDIFSNKYSSGGIYLNVDNGNKIITSGNKGYVTVNYSGILTSYEILSNISGSTSIDVYKTNFLNFPPTNLDTITSGNYINLNNSNKALVNNLSGWTVEFFPGDIFSFYVISASSINKLSLVLNTIKIN